MIESANTMVTLERDLLSPPAIIIPEGLVMRKASLGEKKAWAEAVHLSLLAKCTDKIIDKFFGNGEGVTLCLDKEKIVGIGGIVTLPPGVVFVNYTGVLPSYRRKGIGRTLVCTSIRDASLLGKKLIRVATTFQPPRFDAIRLYLNLGFKFVGLSDECIDQVLSAIERER